MTSRINRVGISCLLCLILAPAPPDHGADSGAATALSHESAQPVPTPRREIGMKALRWLGRMHILVVHFPIALLSAAVIAESLRLLLRQSGGPAPTARFCLRLGALCAVIAVAFGWLHADLGGFGAEEPQILLWHRWVGTAAAAVAIIAVALGARAARRGYSGVWYWICLFSCAGLTAVAAHLGGSLVHGSDFLDW